MFEKSVQAVLKYHYSSERKAEIAFVGSDYIEMAEWAAKNLNPFLHQVLFVNHYHHPRGHTLCGCVVFDSKLFNKEVEGSIRNALIPLRPSIPSLNIGSDTKSINRTIRSLR